MHAWYVIADVAFGQQTFRTTSERLQLRTVNQTTQETKGVIVTIRKHRPTSWTQRQWKLEQFGMWTAGRTECCSHGSFDGTLVQVLFTFLFIQVYSAVPDSGAQ